MDYYLGIFGVKMPEQGGKMMHICSEENLFTEKFFKFFIVEESISEGFDLFSFSLLSLGF